MVRRLKKQRGSENRGNSEFLFGQIKICVKIFAKSLDNLNFLSGSKIPVRPHVLSR